MHAKFRTISAPVLMADGTVKVCIALMEWRHNYWQQIATRYEELK